MLHFMHGRIKTFLSTRLPRKMGVLLCVCVLAYSCAGRETVRRVSPEPFRGQITVETLKKAIIFEHYDDISSRADVRVYKKGKPAGSFNGVFAYKMPENLRLSLFGPFGVTVMDLLVTGNVFQVFLPSRNIIYEWVPPEIFLDVPFDDRFRFEMDEHEDMVVLYAYKKKPVHHDLIALYIFDRTYLLNRAVSLYEDDTEIMHIEFSDFNGRIPESIKIAFMTSARMELYLEDIMLDSEISDAYFRPFDHKGRKILPFKDVLMHFNESR